MELLINDTRNFRLPHGSGSPICVRCSFRFIMSFDSLSCAVREASERPLSPFTSGKAEVQSSAPTIDRGTPKWQSLATTPGPLSPIHIQTQMCGWQSDPVLILREKHGGVIR